MPAELHCHTMFSVDAYGTPEALVDAAAERGITTLSITEHNHLGSLERGRARAAERGIRYLPGLELDGSWDGRRLHLLGIGIDPDHAPLRRLAEENFSIYASHFELFFEHFEALGYPVSREELTDGLTRRYPTNPAPVLNQWYARDVLVGKGVFPDKEAFNRALAEIRSGIVSERGPEVFKGVGTFQEAREAVHGAGGVLLLAHVSQYHPGDGETQMALIHELLDEGLDGFELYHPSNAAEPHFDRLVREAKRIGCAISGGSDCHNAPEGGATAIGCSRVPDWVVETIDSLLR